MRVRFSDFGCLVSLAIATLTVPAALGTSISGDGETIESTPTPRQSTIRPTPTPEPEAVDEPTPIQQTPTQETAAPASPKPPAGSVNEAFGALMRAAEARFNSHDYAGAIKKIDEADALLPGNVNALNIRGAIYAETGDYEAATKLYNQALKLQPDSFWPAYNLAEVFFIQKKYPKAREAFTSMFSKFPGNELLQFKIFLTYLEEKNDKEAKTILDKIPFLSSTPAYYFSWAAWEFRHNNAAGAEEWLKSGERIFGKAKTRFYNQSLADLKMVPLNEPPTTPPE